MEDQQSNELIIINEMSDTHLDSTPALINGLVVAKRRGIAYLTLRGRGLASYVPRSAQHHHTRLCGGQRYPDSNTPCSV
jgi:hypothetical protein